MAVPQPATFEELLLQMQQYKDEKGNSYPRKAALLPPEPSKNNTICNVDLDTRRIDSPSLLSVQFDHNAEVIYFKCARYYENIDLATMVCIIEYINGNGDCGLYWVPTIDLEHSDISKDEYGNIIETPLIYIPWCIQGLATAYSGTVTYSIRFYRLNNDGVYLYNLSTIPATGQVLHGMDLTDDKELEVFKLESSVVTQIYNDISRAQIEAATYWTDV